jgi:hypothetical protein
MMSRQRANSITLHVPASSLGKPTRFPNPVCSTPCGIDTYGHRRYRTQRNCLALTTIVSDGAALDALKNLERRISNRSPSPLLRCLIGIRRTPRTGRVGEPPGHTPQLFCRGGSPKFSKATEEDVFWTLSARATQRTLTRRNNATLTERRDANTIGRITERRQLGDRSTQLGRH